MTPFPKSAKVFDTPYSEPTTGPKKVTSKPLIVTRRDMPVRDAEMESCCGQLLQGPDHLVVLFRYSVVRRRTYTEGSRSYEGPVEAGCQGRHIVVIQAPGDGTLPTGSGSRLSASRRSTGKMATTRSNGQRAAGFHRQGRTSRTRTTPFSNGDWHRSARPHWSPWPPSAFRLDIRTSRVQERSPPDDDCSGGRRPCRLTCG